tara:strand:- start:125 stop:583 length:459 start_codon:yes stop_codon:yes gene_type:complete
MTETPTTGTAVKDDKAKKPKGPLGKLREAIDDQEEQVAILGTFVRLGVVVWAGFIISLNYLTIPGLGKQEPRDITFVASIFTGALASFGLDTAKKRGDGTYKANGDDKPMTKSDIEKMLLSAGNVQTIRVENGLKILPADGVKVIEKSQPKT